MNSNIAAIKFRETNDEFTLKACFDAIKHNTETSKHKLLHHVVTNDVDVAIEETEDFNDGKRK